MYALVTGGTRGLGKAISKRLASLGYNLIIVYSSNEVEAKQTLDDLKGISPNIEISLMKHDLSLISAIDDLLNNISNITKSISLLVNNAGILEQKDLMKISASNWDETLNINLRAPFFLSQAISKKMKPGSSIVNIVSVGGQIGGPKAAHYSASKGGLITLTKSLARILSKRKIRVNAISPGFIRTDMFEHILNQNNIKEIEVTREIPLGVIGETDDIADAIEFIISNKAKYITGHILNVNGGLYI